MNKDLRIIYMGTPEFAVPPLELLVKEGWPIVAVVTATDKPQGRGRKMLPSPVKSSAEKLGVPVLQPANLKSADFQEELKSYRADLQVVVAFRMLPEIVWSMPPKGTFNLHASLLPDYRGAAPINWAAIWMADGEQLVFVGSGGGRS
jgi:methionyl-tRNA formyltransferase